MQKKGLIIAGVIIGLLVSTLVFVFPRAGHIYVSASGRDSGTCTRFLPCRTFKKALALAHPGETIHIQMGTYQESLIVSTSGMPGSPLTIIGEGAVLPAVSVSGDYVTISGVEVEGAISHGILVSGKHVIIENSSVHHSVTENGSGICDGSGSWGSGLKVALGGEDIILRNNSVYENCGEGIAVTSGVNVRVENNIVKDNYSVNIYIDNSPFSVVRDNHVMCTGIYLRDERRPTGIAIAEESYEGWGAQRHDTSIVHNIVDGCYDGISSWDPEMPEGMEINLLVSDNTIINGTHHSISLEWKNQNVLIENNSIYEPPSIDYMEGVTLINNRVFWQLYP
jgi:hypothetical protein